MSCMQPAAVFKLLADPTRLRLLRALSHDRFNVGELTSILGLAQSGVSRHLGSAEGRASRDRRSASRASCSTACPTPHERAATAPLVPARRAIRRRRGDRAVREDDARLQEVLRNRQEQFYPHGDARQLLPGRSWAAWARTLASCCHRSTSSTSGAATDIWRSRQHAGHAMSPVSIDPTTCSSVPRRWRPSGR